jgi:HEAT repeat protein
MTGSDWAGAAPAGFDPALDSEVLDRIVLLLSGYEYFPTAADLGEVTADPVPYLLVIVYDTSERWLPTHHHRAIGALGYFPTETVRAHLDYLLGSDETPDLMRHHVMNALSNGFGDDALDDLEAFLYNDDLQLRLTAVAAIGAIGTELSVDVLSRALPIETSDLVRERIQTSLTSRPGQIVR